LKKALSLKNEIIKTNVSLPEADLSKYGKLPANVEAVINHCSLMKYLCGKASQTGYLMHSERLSVLYVFGHLGEEGKVFVHQVIRILRDIWALLHRVLFISGTGESVCLQLTAYLH